MHVSLLAYPLWNEHCYNYSWLQCMLMEQWSHGTLSNKRPSIGLFWMRTSPHQLQYPAHLVEMDITSSLQVTLYNVLCCSYYCLQIYFSGKLAESEANNCYVIGFDLRHIPSLECHWVPSPSSSSSSSTDSESLQDRGKMSLLDPAQTHLKNYVTHMYVSIMSWQNWAYNCNYCRVLEMDENLKKWHEHWKELPNRLIEPRSWFLSHSIYTASRQILHRGIHNVFGHTWWIVDDLVNVVKETVAVEYPPPLNWHLHTKNLWLVQIDVMIWVSVCHAFSKGQEICSGMSVNTANQMEP